MAFPGDKYAPPGTYTTTNYGQTVPTGPTIVDVPVFIGEGNEYLSQLNLEVVRGSSSSVDQKINNEDQTGRSVVSISNSGVVTLGPFDGVLRKFQVRNYPIVDGRGSGTTATNKGDVKVTLNGNPVVVTSLNAAKGIVEISASPVEGDIVRCTYYYKRTDTLFTDDLSSQVSTTSALLDAFNGIRDVNASDASTEVVEFITDPTVISDPNNLLNLVVDGTTLNIEFPVGSYTMAQVASLVNSNAGTTTLSATVFQNNFGRSSLRLTADQDVTVLDGSANALLFLQAGQTSSRRKTFYTFQGPIVDGSNAGITTTNVSHVEVKVNGNAVTPVSINGTTRAVTLPFAPKVGSTVKVTYYANTWQDTYDDLAHADVLEISTCGEFPNGASFTNGADFVLHEDKIFWGAAYTVVEGDTADSSEAFDSTQITASLIDNKTFLSPCSSVVTATGGIVTSSRTSFELPYTPTLGNGRDTNLGTSLFQSASNGRAGVSANRPDVVEVFWGFGPDDALNRGSVDVISVEGNVVTLASPVPVGADVYANFFYNQLVDAEYTVTAKTSGVSGVGTYEILDSSGDNVLSAKYVSSSKGSSLTGVSLAWPSGSELTTDVRYEGVSGDDFTGPVEETVTVQFASRNATPARYTVKGAGPYYFIEDQSDKVSLTFGSTTVTNLDLANPTGTGSGFFAHIVGDELVYDAASGGSTFDLDANLTLNLKVDTLDVPVTFAAATGLTLSDFVSTINMCASGYLVELEDDATVAATVILPASLPNADIPNYFVGWKIGLGTASDVASGQIKTIVSYDSSTRTATVNSNWSGGSGLVLTGDFLRIFNPDTRPQIIGTTVFDAPTVINGVLDEIRITYVGNNSGSYASNVGTIAAATYATSEDLAAAVQTQLDTINLAAQGTHPGFALYCEATADNRLKFILEACGDDDYGVVVFDSTSVTEGNSFASLAGLDQDTDYNQGNMLFGALPVAYAYSVQFSGGTPEYPYDRLILRNRVLPGGSGLYSFDGRAYLDQCGLEVVSGSAIDMLGLTAATVAEGGFKATVLPASLLGKISLSDGQDGSTYRPVVKFYDGTGTNAANNVFSFRLDGVPVTVTFTASETGTSTPVGPVGTSGTIGYQIADAIGSLSGTPFGNRAAVISAGLVRMEGSGIRINSNVSDETSQVLINSGTANSVLGFSEDSLASRVSVSVSKLVSALNSHRNSTFSNYLFAPTTLTSGYFGYRGIAASKLDSSGAEYLYLQNTPASSAGFGTTSVVLIQDAEISSVVTDSWLATGTGVNEEDGNGSIGESAVNGFFVTSDNPNGSGSIDTSVLNSGTGQDGFVGQTYRDLVTGLTFTLLPRGYGDNPDGPWTSYPTGSNATFRINASKTFTTNANIGHNMIPGLEVKVANTYNVASGNTATLSTFDRGGNEPSNGDLYYVSYTYRKDPLLFKTNFFSKLSDVVKAYGDYTPNNPVSLAAYLAFANGAAVVGIKQVPKEDGSDQASLESYVAAIEELEEVLPSTIRPGIIVPLRGDSTELYQILKRSCEIQSSIRYKSERTALIGMRSGATMSDASALAQALKSDRMRLVYPDTAILTLTDRFNVPTDYVVDGTMIAAAFAGLLSSNRMDPATPWTNKTISGFKNLGSRLTEVQMNNLASKGVTIFTDAGNGALKVRHGLTTDMSNELTRTPTVRQISDYVQRLTRDLTDPFIGMKFLPGVISQIEGRLSQMFIDLKRRGIISDFKGVKARVSPNDPTTLEIEAYYRPVFPLLYILVTYNLSASI